MFPVFARTSFRQVMRFLMVPLVLVSLMAESALADVTIAPDSPAVGFCAPFGFGSTVEPGNPGNDSSTRPWAPYAIYVYRNVPAFSAEANDFFAFDLGAANDIGVYVEIALAHGPDAPLDNIFERNLEAFTVIASNRTGGQLGNATVGDYELTYAMNRAFDFDGGTLLIRVGMPSVSYQADDTCTPNLVWGGIGDSSGYFYRRIIRATNPDYPYGTTVFSDTSGIPAFRVITGNSTDLSVSLSGTTQALLGESLQYDADYFNASQVDSTQTELVISLPPNINFDNATPGAANCQDVSAPGGTTITCALGVVPAGDGGTVTIDATASSINSGTGDVDATIDSAEPDSNEADNSDSLRVAIDEFEFEIEDSRFDHFDRAIPFTATVVGEMQTHSIIYRNLSTVDQGITFISPPAAPFTLRDPNNCESQTIANECEFFIDFMPQAVGSFADNVIFNAYPIASSALASVDVELSGRGVNSIADLAMSKTTTINSVTPGASGSDLVTWRLEVTNNGPATAEVVVTDVLPNGVTVIPGMKPSAYDDTTGIWDVGSVAEGGVRVLNIPTMVAPGVPDCLENTATAGFAAGQTVSDDIDGNDSASASIGTPGCADLIVTTALSDDIDRDLVTATLEIRVTNAGPTPATGVELVATNAAAGALSFDPNCPLASSNAGGAQCSYNAPDLLLGNIAPGDTATTRLTVFLDSGANDQNVSYDYTVTANETDPDPLTNRANGGFPIVAISDSVFPGSSFCFIATAAYGSYMQPEVALLREFRDSYLLTHAPGRAFVEWYYATSPPYADMIAANDQLRWVARLLLTPMVYSIKYPVPALLMLLSIMALATRRRWVSARR